MKTSYFNLQMDQLKHIQNDIDSGLPKPRLLLHACCAPCSSSVLELLSAYFDITIYYYNPNIHPEQEYIRRLEELKTFVGKIDVSVALIEDGYDVSDYFEAVKTEREPELQTEPERGERCRRCYEFRMKKGYEYACRNGFDYFTTTLSISPHKDAEKINTIGMTLEKEAKALMPESCTYLFADFKKKNGYLRSLELSKEYGLYRQDYCGCIFSKQNQH